MSKRDIDTVHIHTYVLIFFVCNVINALNNVSSISRDFAFIWQLVSVRTGERDIEAERDSNICIWIYVCIFWH